MFHCRIVACHLIRTLGQALGILHRHTADWRRGEYDGKGGKYSENVFLILGKCCLCSRWNWKKKKPEIDHRRSKAVVEMQIMGATMCPSTFEDSLPSAPPLYYIEQLLKCLNSIGFQSSPGFSRINFELQRDFYFCSKMINFELQRDFSFCSKWSNENTIPRKPPFWGAKDPQGI